MVPLADPEPNQQPPCQANRTSGGDTKGCTDASFDVSPTSPESQPCLGESHKQLITEAIGATSQPGIMMIDALCDEGFSHGAGSTPISTSMLAYNPIPASPEEMSQTLLHDSEVYLNTSRDDAILEARTSSPAAGYHPNHNKSKTSATRATGPAMMKDSVVASVAGYLDLTPRFVGLFPVLGPLAKDDR
ncbi:hypothetical protein BHE90_016302 [Fusarium euwallaceae]|uniref:Uncharacterized protein n=1 Tax=Fusarium euwallaceae TaxID=1147111 RepID=A0A430L0S5_9HYPO|nr:hypothetical protein BHE90_016302 [Fusarium euwallaceae]